MTTLNITTPDPDISTGKQKGLRGPNFQSEEDEQLTKSWLHVSQDPIIGSNQKSGSFWERVSEHFKEHSPIESSEDRSLRSIHQR
jgi:hypothetical protein